MPAHFLVETVFRLSGRGVVAAGDVLDGTVNAGMWTEPLSLGGALAPLRVSRVEWMQRPGRPDGQALVFDGLYDPAALEGALPVDRVLYVTGGDGERV